MPTFDALFFFNPGYDLCVNETLDNQKIMDIG